MKEGGLPHDGFTVVEALIVLAISGLLAVTAMLIVSGRQNKVQFQTAINDIKQQVQQVINETASGNFPDSNNFTCSAAGSGQPTIRSVSGGGQGTNANCVFLGNVVQFGAQDATIADSYQVIPLAGNQSGTTVSTANPIPIDEITGTRRYNSVIKLSAMYYDAVAGNMTSGAGFLAGDSNGSITTISNGGATGGQQLSLYAITGTRIDSTQLGDMTSRLSMPLAVNYRAVKSIAMCFDSQSTDQSGRLTIGSGTTGGLGVTLKIYGGAGCS